MLLKLLTVLIQRPHFSTTLIKTAFQLIGT